MKIHIITPFSRLHLWQELCDHLRPFDVQWHPIGSIAAPPLAALVSDQDRSWISPCTFDDFGCFDACYAKLNFWLETNEIHPNDYYVFMCDDDGYTLNFFNQLRQCTHEVVWVTVLGRVFFQNPASTNCRVGASGLRSYCVRGSVLEHLRFNSERHDADGLMAETLHTRIPHAYQSFRPDMIVLYNYFEPRRWTDPEF